MNFVRALSVFAILATLASTALARNFYAMPILRGSKNQGIRLVGMSRDGMRAVMETYTSGRKFSRGKTRLVLLQKTGNEWDDRILLSRSNGGWIGGVTLTAPVFSHDGRFLVFSIMEEIENHDSQVVKVLEVDTGEEVFLGKGRIGNIDKGDRSRLEAFVSGSAWFKTTYPGKTYDEVFGRYIERCEGTWDEIFDGKRKTDAITSWIPRYGSKLIVSHGSKGDNSKESASFPLNRLLGESPMAWQMGGSLVWTSGAYAADCRKALIIVEEVLSSGGYSFWSGGSANDAHAHVLEIGEY